MPDRGKALVAVLACVLSRLVQANDAKPSTGKDVVTKFHALRPPSISIRDYLERINKYAGCSPECFVLALVYIDRLIAKGGLELTSLNVHRVIITAVLLASKFFDDQYYNNAYFAKVTTTLYEKYFIELAGHCMAPPEHVAACDCRTFASMLNFDPEDIRFSGLRGDLLSVCREGGRGGGGGGGGGGGEVDAMVDSPVMGPLVARNTAAAASAAASAAAAGGHSPQRAAVLPQMVQK